MRRDPLLFFLAIVATLMVYATLFPFRFSSTHSEFLTWSPADDRGNWLDVLLNLYFFLPFGLLCGIRFRSQSGYLLSFFTAMGISLSVEIAQAYIPGRYSSFRDVFLNTVGAFAGMLIAHLPIFDRQLITIGLRNALANRGALILLSFWSIYQFFPFIPLFKLRTLSRVLDSPIPWTGLHFETVELAVFSCFAVGIWAEYNSPRSTIFFAMLMTLLTPGQIFLWGRNVPLEDIAASILGWSVGLWLARRPTRPSPRVLAAIAIGFLLWRELHPFIWQPEAWHGFSWTPFKATFENGRDGAIRILAIKCFIYWFTLRQIHKATGIPLWRCAAAMAAFFLVAETGQCFQPGRTPEITDSLLCLLGAVPFLNLDGSQDQPD